MSLPTITNLSNNSAYNVSADQWNAVVAGVKNQPFTYLIYPDLNFASNGLYHAKDTYGTILWSSTDAGTIWNYIPVNSLVYIAAGTYNHAVSLQLKNSQYFKASGLGNTNFNYTGSTYASTVTGTGSVLHGALEGMTFNCNSKVGLYIPSGTDLNAWQFKDFFIYDSSIGIDVVAGAGFRRNNLNHFYIENFTDTGIFLQGTSYDYQNYYDDVLIIAANTNSTFAVQTDSTTDSWNRLTTDSAIMNQGNNTTWNTVTMGTLSATAAVTFAFNNYGSASNSFTNIIFDNVNASHSGLCMGNTSVASTINIKGGMHPNRPYFFWGSGNTVIGAFGAYDTVPSLTGNYDNTYPNTVINSVTS